MLPAAASLFGRGLAAGAFGTAVMGLCEYAHVRVRRDASALADPESTDLERTDPVDYDVSAHVPLAAARVLRLSLRTDEQAGALFLVTQAGYGSAFGVVAALLDEAGLRPWQQAVVFFGLTEAMALSLFPLLGGTPPPWRWRAEPLVTSVVQHAAYAAAVVGAQRSMRTSV